MSSKDVVKKEFKEDFEKLMKTIDDSSCRKLNQATKDLFFLIYCSGRIDGIISKPVLPRVIDAFEDGEEDRNE
jgi:hypothetical protein